MSSASRPRPRSTRCSTRSSRGSGPKSRRAGCDVHHRNGRCPRPSSSSAPVEISAIVPVYRSAADPAGAAPPLDRRPRRARRPVRDHPRRGRRRRRSWSVIEALAERDVACPRHPDEPQLRPAQRAAVRHPRRPLRHRSSPSTTTCRTRRRRSPSCLDARRRRRRRLRHARDRAARVPPRPGLADHEARPAERDERRDRPPRQRVPGVPHADPRRVRRLPRPVRLDRRPADLGDDAVLARPRPSRAARRSGTSNYTFRTLVTHALNMMTGFSTLPLQIASIIGFLFTLFGFGILVLVLGDLHRQRRQQRARASPSSPRSSPSSAARSCSRSGSSASTSPGCTSGRWIGRPTSSARRPDDDLTPPDRDGSSTRSDGACSSARSSPGTRRSSGSPWHRSSGSISAAAETPRRLRGPRPLVRRP